MEHTERRNKESGDHEIMLLIIGVFAIIAGSIWLAKESDFLIHCWKILYLPQAKSIAWFSTTFLGHLINDLLGHTNAEATGLVQFIKNTPAHEMTARFCWSASGFLGKYYLFIFMPLGCYLTIKVYKKTQGESAVYQKFKNAKKFTRFVRKNDLDAREQFDETSGSSLSLMDFALKNNLFIKDENVADKNCVQIDFQETTECFIKQLGKTFTYIEDLINQPYGWAALKIIQFIPEKYRAKILEEKSQQHLYDFTLLIALLESARKYGVVPCAIFIRLKKHYPSLWYGLNNLGRKVAFVEGAGLSAQYAHEISQHEQGNQKPKLQSVQAAVEGFEEIFQIEENHCGKPAC